MSHETTKSFWFMKRARARCPPPSTGSPPHGSVEVIVTAKIAEQNKAKSSKDLTVFKFMMFLTSFTFGHNLRYDRQKIKNYGMKQNYGSEICFSEALMKKSFHNYEHYF